MKVDKSFYREPELRIFEDLAYNGALRNQTIYSGSTQAAHRQRIPLTQHSIFKTQFSNDLLRKALLPKNAQTAVKIFREDGTEIFNPTNLPKVMPEYGSLVFEVEPTDIPKYVECALYDLYIADDVFLKKDLDEALNINLDLIKASLHSFKSIKIEQNGEDLTRLICNADNKLHNVILAGEGNITVTTNAFLISPNTDIENAYLELKWGSLTFFREKLIDVCNNVGSNWTVASSKDLFETGKSKIWLYNSYKLEVSSSLFRDFIGLVGMTPEQFSIKIGDASVYQIISEEVGLDLVSENSFRPKVTFNEATFEGFKTEWISGKSYFPDTEDRYELPIHIKLENNAYLYYRYFSFDYGVDEEIIAHNFTSMAWGEVLEFDKVVSIDKNTQDIIIRTYDVLGNVIDDYALHLGIVYSRGLEDCRAKCPSQETLYPLDEEITPWNPKLPLAPYEPKFWDGEYTSEAEENALAFELDTHIHYSHVSLDLETDGKVYIKSKGNTGWLDTDKELDVFNNPTANGAGCKASEGSYSFGRVNYKGPVCIRILNAHSTRLRAIDVF